MAQADVDALPALLRSSGPEREAAYAALRDLLVRAALAYLVRQRYPLQSFGADSYETLAEDFAQEALATIVRQLDTFRGDSRFTTWAYRIVVNLMADEYRRRAWRRRPLEAAPPERVDGRPDREGPERSAERRETWALIDEVIRDELT
ncbi:MAG: sigma-70 family RNA polymerase sigma factor, partial [Thermomicrobiaceae bacterium]|nr:sigma-70 family RNA polymerase sigma factor [Thermomicrobiaceae bacterium]